MRKETLLRLHNISVRYGGIKALDGADISLYRDEIVALVGPNGAGKSTILKTIFGLVPIHSGSVFFHEKEMKPVPYEVVRKGVSFVPQGRRVFDRLTVEENLEVGGLIMDNKMDLKMRIIEIMETFPVLKQLRKAKAETLSGGQQQILALARGLVMRPKMLLLDEPTLGLAPKTIKEVFEKIEEINKKHKTAILVVEHNIKSLFGIASRGYVLEKGKIVAKGTSQKLLESGILGRVFMGKSN